MYVVTVVFEVEPQFAAAFREAVLKQAANSMNLEPGCSRFDVCFDRARAERFFLYEIYDDRAAFDLHMASDHFADFDRRVAPWTVVKAVETWELN